MSTASKNLSSAAIIIMISTILSRISGYLRETLIINMLGSGDVGDAYNMAFQLPDLMYNLLLGGAIAAAIIPVLSGYIAKDEEKEGWKVLSTFINIMFIAMLIFCAIGMIFTPNLLSAIYGKGFYGESQFYQNLTIKLTRILFPSVSFLMLAGLCNGILNAYNRFTAAAFGPVIYNLGGVLSLALFGENSEQGAVKVAIGVMISAIAYFFIQLLASYRNIVFYRPLLHLKNPGVKRLFYLALPSMISSAVVQINLIVSSTFTTLFRQGSLVMYNTANKAWQLPLGIFAQSIGIALLPSMSASYAVNDTKQYKFYVNKGLRTVLYFALPCATVMIVLADPIIRTFFKFSSKNVSEENVTIIGFILMFFSIALISQSIVAIMTRAFFAINDTKTPLYIGICTIFVNYISCYILYKLTPLETAGMAFSYSISSTFNAVCLLVILRIKLKQMGYKEVLYHTSKIAAASLVMGVVLLIVDGFIKPDVTNKINQLFYMGIEFGIGGSVFLFLTWLFKIDETDEFIGALLKKLFKKNKQENKTAE